MAALVRLVALWSRSVSVSVGVVVRYVSGMVGRSRPPGNEGAWSRSGRTKGLFPSILSIPHENTTWLFAVY